MKIFLLGAFGLLAASAVVLADNVTACVNLENLVPYTDPVAGWSDWHSDVVLSWPRDKEPGLQQLVSLVGWSGAAITPSLLRWNLAEQGKPLALNLRSRTYRPDKVVEVDAADGLELNATVAWPAFNALILELTIVNKTSEPRTLELNFDYPGKGQKPDWKGPCPVNEFFSLEDEPEGCWSTLYVHNEHGRNFLWVSGFVAGMSQGTTMELECLADLSRRQLFLGAQGKTKLRIPMGFGRFRGRAQTALEEAAAKIKQGWTPEEETLRWRSILEKAAPISVKYRGQEKYQRMYAHAISSLNGLCIRGEGGYTGNQRIPYTTKYGLAMPFFWDTSFSCVGLREFDPALAQEAIECFTRNVGPRGSLPGTICDTHRAGEGQAPIMSWAAWLVYERSKDKDWLRRVYPVLAGNNRFWSEYHASARGFGQYFNAGQIADNDARFDSIQGGAFCQALSGFESPDLNAFLVVDGRSLGRMAAELGRTGEAGAWNAKSDALAGRIISNMYFPKDGLFYDVKAGEHEQFSGVKTPNMFLPLWAGVPLEQDQIKAVIEGHMLNPKEFYRPLLFPSLSYDNPKYDPAGYWRGRIWPHIVYWMIQTMWRQGYHQQAEQTADWLLAMLQKTPWFHENYESASGAGIGAADYNWSCSTVIELLLERYKDPML